LLRSSLKIPPSCLSGSETETDFFNSCIRYRYFPVQIVIFGNSNKILYMVICPLCFNKESFTVVDGPDSRAYRECRKCRLIFTETRNLPTGKSDKKRYLTHKNGIQYKGYVDFLNQAIEPALPFLNNDMQGLDFGCGPVPTLSEILDQEGFNCDNYDPIFFPEMPKKEYDFIFASECFEHFFFPAKEMQRIKNLLKPGGILIILTETWKSVEDFASWYYARDFTHVSFFHNHTFSYIAEKFGFEPMASFNGRVRLMQKRIINVAKDNLRIAAFPV
jgi:hypothetical protein